MASNTRKSSTAITSENKGHSFKMKAYWLSRSAIHKLRHSKRDLLLVLLLASSAVALTSPSIWRAMLSGNNAAFVSQSVPASMTAGGTYPVTVTMLNQGTTTWTPEQLYRLGSQNPQDNGTWGGRVSLPGASVSPGATATFSFTVTAPSTPGSYNFQWQMVQDGVEWFGAQTPNVAVQVVPPTPLTKLKEYVYAGGRMITSEEQSCVPTPLGSTSASQPVGGGTGVFTFSISSGCSWSATSSASWIIFNGATSGVGDGSVSYTVAANIAAQRVGTITVNGQSFTITQDPNPTTCGYSFSIPNDTFPQGGGSHSVSLTAAGGCAWNAVSSDTSWLTVSPTSGVGSAPINYTVTNNTGLQRVASISITAGGQTFATLSVTQSPNQASCTFSLNPTSQSFDVTGGSGSFNVNTQAGCQWNANVDNNAGWITINGGATGISNGTPMPVSFTVQPNNGGPQKGSISVGNQPFTIVQVGTETIYPGSYQTPDPGDVLGGSAVDSASNTGHGLTTASGFYLDKSCVWMSFPSVSGQISSINLKFDWTVPTGNVSVTTVPVVGNASASISFDVNYSTDNGASWTNQVDQSKSVSASNGLSAYDFINNVSGSESISIPPSVNITQIRVADILQPYTFTIDPGDTADATITASVSNIRLEVTAIPLVAKVNSEGATNTGSMIARTTNNNPEAANGSSPTDTIKQLGIMLSPGSGSGPKCTPPQPGAPSRWLARGSEVLALLIAGCVLALLLWNVMRSSQWRRGDFTEERERVWRLLEHSLGLLSALCASTLRRTTRTTRRIARLAVLLSARPLRLLLGKVRTIVRQAESLWRSSGVARLKPVLRRALIIALIVRLATPLSPAEAEGLGGAMKKTWREMSAYAKAMVNRSTTSGTSHHHASGEASKPPTRVAFASMQQSVASLQVSPTQLIMYVGENYTLSPVPLDSSGNVVQGAGVQFTLPPTTPAIAKVNSFGMVCAEAVGNTTVTAQSGNVSVDVQVQVLSGMRTQSLAASIAQQSSVTANSDGTEPDFNPPPVSGSLATDFTNAVGHPRFSPVEGNGLTSVQLGSDNYQFNAPVASVGGRGISESVAMSFNSRVWNNDNGTMTFNYAAAFPAPGWSMGYGKIIPNYNATATGNNPGDYLLVAADGTRIRLAATYDSTSGSYYHLSDDGSFLRFDRVSGVMQYPDGSRMIFSNVNDILQPTAIINTNGSAITMSYRPYCEGSSCQQVFRFHTAFNAIRDTLGRYLTFHYWGDSNEYPVDPNNGHPAGTLAAIKAPDRQGGQQEVIRVEYQAITLAYNFGGATVNAPSSGSPIQVVRRIYYPLTGKGFLFLDYSTYGMPRKISSRMGMTGSGGTITDGAEIAYTTYDYTTIDPTDPYGRDQGTGSLNDSPQFTKRNEFWQGKTDATGAPTTAPTEYDYSRITDSSTKTETDTVKNVGRNVDEITVIGTDSAQTSFGKVLSVEQRSETPDAMLSKRIYTYTPSAPVEIEKVETIDDASAGAASAGRLVSFAYDQYGNVTDKSESGYGQVGSSYSVYRRTHYDYITDPNYTDPNYINARFLRLANRVSVYDASNTLLSKTETTYDDYASMGEMQTYPLSPGQVPNYDTTYDSSYKLRGNVTAVTTYSQLSPSEVSTTRHAKYDIFGNVVEAEVSCCVMKSFSFSNLTWFSEPDSVTSGDGDPTHLNLQTSYLYNLFTGLLDQETNPDGVPTVYGYDKALRLYSVTNTVTQASTLTQFDQDSNGNDLLSYLSQTTYTDGTASKVITSRQWFDGAGRVVQAGTGAGSAPAGYDMTATVYDGWGRVAMRSNPYSGDASGNPQSGVTPLWTTNTYDVWSRVRVVTLPDQQMIKTDYNSATTTIGATVKTTDPVGRTRTREVDGLGRLVNVTEQNPANGNPEWVTSYSYDVLNNLTKVNQGGQTRTFGYDAKSRLTSETTPEAGTTTYTYTDFDAVSTRKDARGVVTTYTYGDLNLLTGVSYDTTSKATGVATTSGVSIWYKSASPGIGQIATVTNTDGTWSESFAYDSLGRLQTRTRAIDGISYPSQYEYNAIGQMTAMTYPSGKKVNVGHDDRGRLSALQRVDVSGAPAYLSGINYRADGLISSQKLGDGAMESFGYSNDRLQLTSQTVTNGSNTLLSLSYGYQAGAGQMGNGTGSGNSGQLVSVSGTINGQARDQAFTYDNVRRLVTATGISQQGPWARRFDYDRYGNRMTVWNAVSGGNQLQTTVIQQDALGIATNRIASVNGTGLSYDASGNVTGDGASSYTYDAVDRIVNVSTVSGGESYGYDAGNHRVKKVVGGVVTHYIWEGNNVIAEYERGGANTPGTGTRYYHQDRLSTRVITDGSGNVMGTTDQLPFGEEIGFTGESEKHKFGGYERDATGLDYAVNRHFNSQHGRFMQVDPIKMASANPLTPQSLNLYAYTANDPVNSSDPLGLFMSEEEGGGGGGGDDFVIVIETWEPGPDPVDVGEIDSMTVTADPDPISIDDGIPQLPPFLGGPLSPRRRPHFHRRSLPQKKPPCPPVPVAPPGVNVDDNINTAQDAFLHRFSGGPPEEGMSHEVEKLLWFKSMVQAGGPWDYKKYDKSYNPKTQHSKYEDFGNFNYGAAGVAAGFISGQLERLAGRVQDPNSSGIGGTKATELEALLGIGGQWPYGDQYTDNAQIRDGVAYYEHKFIKRDCE